MIEYKPIEKNLEEGMGQLGGQIRSMPHIVIGKKEPPNPPSQPIQPNQNPSEKPFFSAEESKIIDYIKRIGIIIAVVAIIGYSAYRLIWS